MPPCPGPLAQLAEQRTFNPRVVGSIPTGPTKPQVSDLTAHWQSAERNRRGRTAAEVAPNVRVKTPPRGARTGVFIVRSVLVEQPLERRRDRAIIGTPPHVDICVMEMREWPSWSAIMRALSPPWSSIVATVFRIRGGRPTRTSSQTSSSENLPRRCCGRGSHPAYPGTQGHPRDQTGAGVHAVGAPARTESAARVHLIASWAASLRVLAPLTRMIVRRTCSK